MRAAAARRPATGKRSATDKLAARLIVPLSSTRPASLHARIGLLLPGRKERPMTLDRDRIRRGGKATGSHSPTAAIAPGRPGIAPTWTSSAKDMVGCSLGHARLWFTLGFGIVNEVYYPRVDLPQIRDLGFIVAGPDGFWSEVKRNQDYTLRLLAPGVPAVEILHEHARYKLQLRIAPDPRRDVLAIECRLDGDADLGLYVLIAPH